MKRVSLIEDDAMSHGKEMIGVMLRNKKRAEWVREQTHVNNILVEMKNVKTFIAQQQC